MAENVRREDVDGGVHAVGVPAGLSVLRDEGRDPPLVIHRDEVAVVGVVVGVDGQGGRAALFPVKGDKVVELHVQHDVAVEKDEGLADKALEGRHTACRPQGLCLPVVADGKAEAAPVAEVLLDDVPEITREDVDLAGPPACKQLHLVLKDRLSPHGDHGLGDLAADVLEPRAFSAGNDRRDHRAFSQRTSVLRVRFFARASRAAPLTMQK